MDAAAVARDVNARILDIARTFGGGPSARFDFVCECGCFELVNMSVAQYRAIGEAKLPGHSAERSGPGSVAA